MKGFYAIPQTQRSTEQLPRVSASIVIPTYNERGNVPTLFERIDNALSTQAFTYEVIIVDDDSPDGTWRAAREQACELPIRVIRRTRERGLTSAVLKGMASARYETIVVMDADLQHPPELIPQLLDAIHDGHDIAVASRYSKRGDFGEFGWIRTVASLCATFLAHTLFREARHVNDVLSGFFAFRKSVVKTEKLNPVGFKILLEILVVSEFDDIAEIGYTFGNRHRGESKLGVKNTLNYLRHLFRLAHRKGILHQFGTFCVVGAIGAGVNLSVLYGLTSAGIHYLLAGAVAIEAGLLSNFALNMNWTFADQVEHTVSYLTGALGKDHLVRAGGMALNFMVLFGLTHLLDIHYLLSQLAGIGVGTLWNFGGNTWWTWE